MPRIKQPKARNERQLTIVLTFTGSLADTYDAARRALDAGVLQDAMADFGGTFAITNAEVK